MTLSPAPTPAVTYPSAPAPADATQLLGSWVSTDDPSDQRTFRADGTTIETEASGPSMTSTYRWRWIYYHAPDIENPPTIVALELTESTATPLIYSVEYPRPNHLRLGYTGGRILDYTRLN
ncbi:hypothetical protein EF294_11780 [Gordonia oryzae]|uniref:Lipocalin-like domain-containing protein n=2 Tax=Gordonia oryzae TaxID=2487349 RepID=A0A3N4H460_9ACTN|nr:hypothetical protein EF294_11780 [Gordonia oryzae]